MEDAKTSPRLSGLTGLGMGKSGSGLVGVPGTHATPGLA